MARTPEQQARLEYLKANFDEGGNPLQSGELLEGEENLEVENSVPELAAALAAEIAIGEGGRLGGASVGAAFGGVGAIPGAILGGLGGGAAGSIARQRMLDPEGDLNYGDVVASALINVIPGGKYVKAFKNKAANSVASQAVMGATVMPAATTIEKIIDEDRLPTKEELLTSAGQGAILGGGLGVAGSLLGNAYIKFAGTSRSQLNNAYKSGDPDAKILVDGIMRNAREYSDEVKDGYGDLRLSIKENTMDSRGKLQELQDQSGGGQYKSKSGKLKVENDTEDYYLRSRLAEPKIQMRNSEISEIVDLDSKWLVAKADEMDVPAAELSQSINKYLYSKHAIAFNKSKAKGFKGEGSPAGISTEDAQAYIKNFESSNLNVELKNIIDSRSDLSNQILDTLVDGGIVGKAKAKEWRKIFPNYVPLNRVMEDGAKFSPGKYTAEGSDRSVADIGDNIIGNLSTAIRAAETNKANQAFLRLVQKDVNKENAGEILTVYKPKKGSKRPEGFHKDSVVDVFIDGEVTSLAFRDKGLALAMTGQNREVVSGIAKLGLMYNRFIGQMYTRFNPEFVIPNLFRDRSEAIVNSTAKMGLGRARGLLNPFSAGTDMNTIRRSIYNKGKVSADPQDAKMDALYKQFQADGGSSGSLSSSTISNIEDSIQDLQKRMSNPTSSTGRKIAGVFDNINSIVEDSTRFGVYRSAINSGMSRKQAALAARDSSFDPLMRGSKAGKLQAAYLFVNPAIQGSRNFIRSMKNPKVLAGTMASLGTTALSIDLHNQSIDPEWKDKLIAKDGSSWKTDKSFTIVTGKKPNGELTTFSIQIGYSLAPFKKLADYGQQQVIQRGIMGIQPSEAEANKTLLEKANELGSSFVNSYNPMGGSLWPTPMRPWTDLASNKNGLGKDIKPSWLLTKNISDVEKVYPWTMETRGGEMAISFAEQLDNMGIEVSPESIKYLYQTWVGGPGQSVGRLFNVASNVYNGEPIKKSDRLILRRFFGESSAETFSARGYNDQKVDNLEKIYGTMQQKGTRIARSTFNEMQSKDSNAERMLVLQNSLQENPTLSKQILKSVIKKTQNKAAGITSYDSRIKNLPVAARAEYFIDKMDTMPPKQLGQYLGLQQQRGVLTKAVVQMMQQSQAFRDKFQQR